MAYYDIWYVNDDYLTEALKQLDEDGVDMTKVFILPVVTEKRASADYKIVYNKDKRNDS